MTTEPFFFPIGLKIFEAARHDDDDGDQIVWIVAFSAMEARALTAAAYGAELEVAEATPQRAKTFRDHTHPKHDHFSVFDTYAETSTARIITVTGTTPDK